MFYALKEAIKFAIEKYKAIVTFENKTYPLQVYGKTREVTLDVLSLFNECITKHNQVVEANSSLKAQNDELRKAIDDLKKINEETFSTLSQVSMQTARFNDYSQKLSEAVMKYINFINGRDFNKNVVIEAAVAIGRIANDYPTILQDDEELTKKVTEEMNQGQA